MRLFMKVFSYPFFFFLWVILKLRYRIEVKGLDKIKGGGILFLPNHPAEMDPIILVHMLWWKFRPHPLAVEHFYYIKGIRFFMELVGALPLPTMDIANKWKVHQVKKLKAKILEELKKGENFLIYPSGKLKNTPDEKVGGASMTSDLLAEKPALNVVLVRTKGLWGSMFSRALTGQAPDFGSCLWKGLKIVLKNGIFFVPKRKVEIDISWAPANFPRKGGKLEINQWLENWYNREGPEELKLVSYAFWRKEFPEVTKPEVIEIEEVDVPEEIRNTILSAIAKMAGRKPSEITFDMHLSHDLGLDSLDISQLHVLMEERFDITGVLPEQMLYVTDVLQAASGAKREDGAPAGNGKKSKWPKEGARPAVMVPDGRTLAEAFLLSCDRMGKATAACDALSGAVSYKKLKRAALVLSYKIRTLPGERIGVLLPSSIGAYVVILACQLAKKSPVMLNWTVGVRSIEHSVKKSGIEVVLSSFRFLSRLQEADLGMLNDMLILLENMRGEISLKDKLIGVSQVGKKTATLMKKLDLPTDGNAEAAIIFTSGTESLPKGVPLSHTNLLSNMNATLASVHLNETDTLYGVLPPFHSFGFAVTGLLPLISGLRVCYAPDPTDSRALANDIEHYKPTLFCCAPTFVLSLLRVADENQLKSLRLIVTGAEKAPDELRMLAHGKLVLEGYGISECSPVVTLERQEDSHKGVGKPLPGIELCVIDTESEKRLPEGSEGEVCIYGPGVFSGYLDNERDPFIRLDGRLWYRSGDRGYIERDGTLMLTGRLKRFVKMGGEMISLGGLEQDLQSICREMGWLPGAHEGPGLAVISRGSESEKPQLILFATAALQKEALNTALREKGVGRLVKISRVIELKEIPLTGTGKTHYRYLEELSEETK